MRRVFIFLLCVLMNSILFAQEQVITTTGTGTSYDAARNNALRYAIESAFGTFVSSETKISNDILQSDEIYAISTGNVSNINEVSKIQIGDNYSVTLNVTVSPSKLVSFVRSKGINVEFDGEAFANRFKTQMMVEKMNEQSEVQIVNSLVYFSKSVLPQCFDYKIRAEEPYIRRQENDWVLGVSLEIYSNENLIILINHINSTLSSISLNQSEWYKRNSIGKDCFDLVFNDKRYTLRSIETIKNLWTLFTTDIFSIFQNNRVFRNAGKYSENLDVSKVNLDSEPSERGGGSDYYFVSGNLTGKLNKDFESIKVGCSPFYPPCKDGWAGTTTYGYIGIYPEKPFAEYRWSYAYQNDDATIEMISNIKGYQLIKK